MNRLQRKGFERIDTKHYYHPYENVEIVYENKYVRINDYVIGLDVIEAVLCDRPKSYAGRKPRPIPKRFRQMCSSGMTYDQLMKEFGVSRRTIAKWKKVIK